jgi:predicted MPP superfamily phosphohydrolase
VRGLHFIVRLIYQGYSYGKYLRKDKVAFISQGLGAGIPFRIGTEGEIVTINLKPE